MRICLFCAGIALIASCTREKTAVVHTEIGSMTLHLHAGVQMPAGDTLEIEQVSQDEFIRLNDYSSLSVRNIEAGQSEWPLSGTLVESGGAIFIVQGRKHTDKTLDRWELLNNRKLTPQAREQFRQRGGSLALQGRCKIIGELTAGREILNRIAALPTDNTGRPLRRITYFISSK